MRLFDFGVGRDARAVVASGDYVAARGVFISPRSVAKDKNIGGRRSVEFLCVAFLRLTHPNRLDER